MANRREFLQGAVAASALPLIAGGAVAATVPRLSSALYKVLFDERYAEARDFADYARRTGTRVEGFKADITSLWFNDLHYRWLKSPAAIAGLTAPSALFCLERLAWDYRMRLAFLAEHHRSSNGTQHALRISNGTLQQAELRAADGKWASRIASYFTQSTEHARASGVTSVDLQISALDDRDTLVSWIIAPISRASV